MEKITLARAALCALAAELQRSLCDVSANAASAHVQLEAARLDALAEMALHGPVDADAQCTMEGRCADISFEIDHVEAEKRTSLETEAVAADDTLQALERAGAEDGGPDDRAFFDSLLARFGPSPLVPVEPTTLNVSDAGVRAALSGRYAAKMAGPVIDPPVIAPRAVAAQDVEIRGLPDSTFVRAGTSLTFEAAFRGRGGSAAQLKATVSSLAPRLRVSAALVCCSNSEQISGTATTGPLSPGLVCQCTVSVAPHCAVLSIGVPASLPHIDAGSWWALRIAVFLGAQAISLGLTAAGGQRHASYAIVNLPRPGPSARHGALHKACARGDTAGVARILAGSTGSYSTEESEGDSDTCLFVVARCGYAPIASLLLAAGASTSATLRNAHPLLVAAGSGHSAVIEALLAMPTTVDVNTRDSVGMTALHFAARRGHAKAVSRLLAAAHVDVNARCYAGKTPLHEALRGSSIAVAELLLADARVNFAAREPQGKTPLFLAIRAWYASCVTTLLASSNVDVNAAVSPSGETPLAAALSIGWVKVARLLIADPRTDVAASRPTALLVPSALRGHVEIVALLLGLPEVPCKCQCRCG